ncbi:MAG TPA: phosphatase PAP2 family protein [Rhizomicrobium sp.]|nr:phosphatase PAP2 family protein [Rhizomicrobium sp.]
MLLWIGIALILIGVACFAIDRRAAHFFHAAIPKSFDRILHATTDWAKGGLWLIAAALALVVSCVVQWRFGPSPDMHRLARVSLAFLVCLAAASVVLHSIKIVLGRRRPRDELELNLYGFRPFTWDLRKDSFPSGHALTISCVAVVMSGIAPEWAPLCFAGAAWLALTRALLNSHYLSDVLVGAGIALVVTREMLWLYFPDLTRPWF